MRWYVSRNGQTSGPHEEVVVRGWVQAGQIGAESFLRDEASPDWRPLAQTPLAPPIPIPVRTSATARAAKLFGWIVGVLVFWSTVFVVGLRACFNRASSQETAAPRAAPNGAAARSDYSFVELSDLLGEYSDNEVRADAKFKGRRVVVSGVVTRIANDIVDHPYLIVGSGESLQVPALQCMLNSMGRAASLSPGDRVTVAGLVRGKVFNVQLSDCDLQ